MTGMYDEGGDCVVPVAGVRPSQPPAYFQEEFSELLNNSAGLEPGSLPPQTQHLQLHLQHHDLQPHSDALLLLRPTQDLLAALCVRLPPQSPPSMLAAPAGVTPGAAVPAGADCGASAQHSAAMQGPAGQTGEDEGSPEAARALLQAIRQQTASSVIAATPHDVLDFVHADAGSACAAVQQVVAAASQQVQPGGRHVRVVSFVTTAAELLESV